MEAKDIKKLRDSLNIGVLDGDLITGVWNLSDELDLRWVKCIGGFAAVLRKDPSIWIPLCPVKGCEDYSAGSHYCVHMQNYIASMETGTTSSANGCSSPSQKDVTLWIDTDAQDESNSGRQFSFSRKPLVNKLSLHKPRSASLSAEDDEDFKVGKRKLYQTVRDEGIVAPQTKKARTGNDVVEVKRKGSERLFTSRVNEAEIIKLFEILCEDRQLEFESLYGEDHHLKLLNSIGKAEYKSLRYGVTVSRLGTGHSLRVKLPNGTYFFTCGEAECFAAGAESLRAATFYCAEHENRKKLSRVRQSTKAMETIQLFQDAIKTLAAEQDPNYSTKGSKLIGPDTWVKVLASIHLRGMYRHVVGPSFVTLKVSKEGQLTYANQNNDRVMYKCAFNDCYRTNKTKTEVRISASQMFLCPQHQDNHPEFVKMMIKFQKIIGNKSPPSISANQPGFSH